MSGLEASRWAPNGAYATKEKSRSEPGSSSIHKHGKNSTEPALSPASELARFTKIMARLKWKLPFLAEAYRLAITERDEMSESTVANAEIMFKLDFHEYYALLERAIVHLLGVFGIEVSSSFHGSRKAERHASEREGQLGTHRYHANVLDALEAEDCPLYSVLGHGRVHEQLRRAKTLRNRWKTADSSEEDDQKAPPFLDRDRRDMSSLPLESYDFDDMLQQIFVGLEDGFRLAQEKVAEVDGFQDGQVDAMAIDEGWEFIVDAMDWEAV
ncbi:hypothetical protein VTN31DRAFT_4875 [Thermomyces dupontii]|uniref:uncharacterized protein n=1 Tax=Talaromyces thermophilus TaxID=28565 RepID=UPI003741F060